MTAVVADTHTTIWYLRESSRLSESALTALDTATQAGQPIYVTAITLVEVAYLVEKFRLPESAWKELVDSIAEEDSSLTVVPLSLPISIAIRQIPRETVPEMPDRIIAATALFLNLPLVTRDLKIQALVNLKTIW